MWKLFTVEKNGKTKVENGTGVADSVVLNLSEDDLGGFVHPCFFA